MDDWDERILATLRAYLTIAKKFHKYTPFKFLYGREAVASIHNC